MRMAELELEDWTEGAGSENAARPLEGLAPVRDAEAALEKYFGFRGFLDGQAQVVSALLSGRDALVVMPTGGGKSLCFQLPALVMPGVTLVVSPLIALMKDQVDGLLAKKVPATLINSTLSPAEQRERIAEMREGKYKLVYVAPERFRSESFRRALREGVEISLFAVDEAHCLSQWGHDFRPDYLRLDTVLEELGRPQTAAFTATATPEVRADILKHLALRNPLECVRGFARPNLSLRIRQTERSADKYARLHEVIEQHGTGIVYCATRKKVEEVAEKLHSWKIPVAAYHGGMVDAKRSEAQNAFLRREQNIVVATNAFGMGIDRPDVRFVVHFEVPGSVEAYYQEAGRAGRDGEAALCELFFNYADTRTQEFFIEGNNPGFGMIQEVYRALRDWSDERGEVVRTIADIAAATGSKNTMSVSSSLSLLARHGYLARFDVPGQRTRGTRLLRSDVGAEDIEIDRESLLEKERRDRARLKSMIELAYSEACRQRWILDYFGEKEAEVCGNCDRCFEGGTRGLRGAGADELLVARKALSGVARMSHKVGGEWQGRFGRGRVVQMLVGSRSKEILGARLDELSTYGILKSWGAAYLHALFREFESAGLVEVSRGEYPLMTLTPKGEKVMRGESGAGDFRVRWPRSPGTATNAAARGASGAESSSASATAADEEGGALRELGFDEELFTLLKKRRAELAAAAGNVPVYVIFSNATLEFFTRLKPRSVDAGLKIRGVGKVKAERYLEEFLEVIREWEEGTEAE